MKHSTRILLAALLVLAGTSALPFEDGFEAHASTCIAPTKIDLGDGLRPVLLKPSTLSCVDGATLKTQCVMDGVMCKREAAPLPPQPGIPACTYPGIAGNPYVQPAGFVGHPVPWSQLMLGAPFPYGNSYLAPVGSYTLRALNVARLGPSMAGRYMATPFVAEQGGAYLVSWVAVQRQSEVPGYPVPRNAASMFVSISPCAGDLRPGDRFSGDPWLTTCRASLSSGSLKFGTGSTCRLQAGKTYYLNIAAVEPSDGLTTTETTCSYRPSEGRCEVNMQGK